MFVKENPDGKKNYFNLYENFLVSEKNVVYGKHWFLKNLYLKNVLSKIQEIILDLGITLRCVNALITILPLSSLTLL